MQHVITALGFAAMVLFTSSEAAAQNALDRLRPTLIPAPVLLVSSAPTTLRILDSTGVGAAVESKSISVVGSTFNIAAKISLGRIEVMGSYKIEEDVGTLLPGLYDVVYNAEARYFDQTYSGETKTWRWRMVVVDSANIADAIEYYHSGLDHFFLTILPIEIQALDTGQLPGWERTGQRISVLVPGSAPPEFDDVCRFYGLPEAGLNTHFYSAYRSECDLLLENGKGSWVLETDSAFRIFPIDLETGMCPANYLPVHRLWNGRPAANHRYTTSDAVFAEMIAKGWVPEGNGPDVAVWCALPPP